MSKEKEKVKMYDPKEFGQHWLYKAHKVVQDRKVKKEYLTRSVKV